MKIVKFFAVIAVILVLSSCNNQGGVVKKSLENEIDSVSYSLGLNAGNQMRVNFAEIDNDLFIQGFQNGIDSANFIIENSNVDLILRTFFQKKRVEQQEKQKAEALKKAEEQFGDIKEQGVKFLEENKMKSGVKTTESGLQYIVLKEGSGDVPKATSKVRVHYHGTLIDGTVFDSSVDKGKPTDFFANQVIKGWTEGLQLMKVGSKYKFFVPQELAYGAFPRQGSPIKPFSALIFEVELLDIL